MGYMNEIEQTIRENLAGKLEKEDLFDLVCFVKDKLLASYKNGLKTGREDGEKKPPSKGARSPRFDSRARSPLR